MAFRRIVYTPSSGATFLFNYAVATEAKTDIFMPSRKKTIDGIVAEYAAMGKPWARATNANFFGCDNGPLYVCGFFKHTEEPRSNDATPDPANWAAVAMAPAPTGYEIRSVSTQTGINSAQAVGSASAVWALSAGPLIVQYSQNDAQFIDSQYVAGGYTGFGTTDLTRRVVLGYDPTKRLFLTGVGYSATVGAGPSLHDLQELFNVKFPMVKIVLNLDGGGSAQLMEASYSTTTPLIPSSDTIDRPVSSAVIFQEEAPIPSGYPEEPVRPG